MSPLGDTNTLPYGATRMGPTLVRIEARVMELIAASFPGIKTGPGS